MTFLTNIDPTKGQFRDVKTVKNRDSLGIRDVSLVRKSNYQPPITPSLPSIPVPSTKSSPYGENFEIMKNPQTWIS